MGGITSRRNGGVEEVDLSSANAYRYPPKSGNYFGSHFIMGGERFETMQPEAYLFGENQDLNFFGNRPTPFPYPAPQAHEPTKTLKSLVNIRKDSLRFVKVVEEETRKSEEEESKEEPEVEVTPKYSYNIEFTFDCDVRCAITVYYFCTEEIVNKQLVYHPRDPAMNSETYHYKRGANQVFNQATHIIRPHNFPEEQWQYQTDSDTIPVAIHCVVEDEDYVGHSHTTLAVVERTSEGGYMLKPLKQKLMVDGLCYLLQEIYGIENKNTENCKEEDVDNSGAECVICMCDLRDTIILPCRHLCLCNCCADNLRYQANNCPICRSPFRALLQIRAMKRKQTQPGAVVPVGMTQTEPPEEGAVSQLGVPTGYEAVSLIEALNGPTNPTHTQPANNDGRSTLRSTRSSPGVSPAVNKRKRPSRQGSRTSQASRDVDVPAAGGDTEVRGDGARSELPAATPETNMEAAEITCPVESLAASAVCDEPSVEIIDELSKSKRPEAVTSEERKDFRSSPTSSQLGLDTDSSEDDCEMTSCSSTPRQPHTLVLSTPDDYEDAARLSSINVSEALSLPGTPVTDGSSFSSTNSTHPMLPTDTQ